MGKLSIAKDFSAQSALACGEAFQRLAEKFIHSIGALKESPSTEMSKELADLVACATNLGFAIELFTKALLLRENIPIPKVHDLKALYELVPISIRAYIENSYKVFLPEQARLLNGRVSITVSKGSPTEPEWNDYASSMSLPDLLERSKDLFQSWRYIFEYNDSESEPHQFHQFEYVPLWCAAEAIRIEVTVRSEKTPQNSDQKLYQNNSEQNQN